MQRGYKHIITILFTLLIVSTVAQPILVSTTSSSGNVSSLTIPFTVSSNTSRILVVSVTSKDKNITSVKYGTTNLTQIAMLSQNSMRSGLYYLVAPATGSANVVIAIASSSNASATVTEYRNVDQSTPFSATASTKNKNDSPSITVSSAIGEVVVSSLGTIQENPTPGSGMTQILEVSSNNSYINFSRKAGAASVTMDYTFASGNDDDWVMVAGSIKGATTGLPVELTEFSAINNKNNVALIWSTASEVNNDYFEIEKSIDGKIFSSIGRVQGNGTSNQYNSYAFEDSELPNGACYYRLIQFDFDGTKTVHKTITIDCGSGAQEKMHSNTINNTLTFTQLKENSSYKIMVFNSGGVLIEETNITADTVITLNHLNTGMYVISLVKNSSEIVLRESTVVH